ncbi:TonB-dependent receptor domain-containing protein [uncultured Paludibaculum sp.]|uniref:TonB-dependent receptor n=1 Tax=uncultured Paludibaculum sp. TaxID=1765020 RepID=UPI002AAB02BA|nr:TonB-dependent receptor [uncultured Paludibaculum sp.]
MRHIIVLVCCGRLLAQNPEGDAAGGHTAKPGIEQSSPFLLKQSVTVTATRGQMETEEAPVSISTVTNQEMGARRVQLLDQALNTVPGLYAFRGKGTQDTNAGVGLRGFAGRGSGQARVLVLMDGQPLNDSYTGQVNWATLPIEEVERVEVVRGSFSALYGGNAMGGVINILTKPVTARQAEVYGQAGNQATVRYGGRVADRFHDRLGLSVAYDRMQSGGYPSQFVSGAGSALAGGTAVTGALPVLTTSGTQTFLLGKAGNNWWNQHAVRVRGDYAFNRRTMMFAQFQRQWSGYGYDQYESFLRTADGSPFDSGAASMQWNGGPRRFGVTPSLFVPGDGQAEFWLVSGRLHHELRNSARLQFGGGRTNAPLNYYSTPGTGSTAAGGPGTISDRPYASWFGSAQYSQRVRSRHLITAGSDLRQDESRLEETSVSNWAQRSRDPIVSGRSRGRAFNEGAYVQDQWRVAERLSLTGGARYDYWRSYDGGYGVGTQTNEIGRRSNQSGSAKAAALWRGPASLAVRGSVGNSFRNPSVYDLYRTWRSSSGITYAANPNLQPERLLGFEAGVSRRWANQMELDGAFFQNRTTNLIYRTTDLSVDSTGNYRQVINAARGRTNGFEAGTRLPLRPWLYATSSYTWNRATILANQAVPGAVGRLVPFVPQHVSSGSLFASSRRVNASVTGRYVSRVFSTDLNTDTTKGVYGAYDPFFTLDAGFTVPFGRHVSAECGAENLLDRIYYNYYPSPGRLVSVRLRIRL